MRSYTCHIIFALLLGISAIPGRAQHTGATAKSDSTSLLIGNQSKMELSVTVPAGSILRWPAFADTLTAHVEILRKSVPDTVTSNSESYTLRQELLITSFDSGHYVIPPIRFRYHQKGDTTSYYTETGPLPISVNTVKTDPGQDIKPIKPPLRAPVTLREILRWVGLGIFVLAFAYGVYYYLKKRKKQEPIVKMRLKPTIPPDEAALEALEALKLKKLWQSGRVKEYFSEMTEIIREYIELRFSVRALEMTTDEIRVAMQQEGIHSEAWNKLNSTLMLADLVKFAKEQPLPAENDRCLNQCMDFVRETRPYKGSETSQVQPELHNPQKPVN